MDPATLKQTLNPEVFRWLLLAGLGLVGFWLMLRFVLAVTGFLVKALCVVGVILVLVWIIAGLRGF